ncbi:MAG: GAF domain-containing protein [Gammaproteobacteria bacterium]
MQRNFTLLSILTAIIVAATVYSSIEVLKIAGLPVQVQVLDAHTARIEPIAGIPMPAGLRAGDRMPLADQPLPTRNVIGINTLSSIQNASLPLGHSYDFVIERDGRRVTEPVSVVASSKGSGITVILWIIIVQEIFLAGLALLILWRGHDRAAAGMALWTIGNVLGVAAVFPLDGVAGVAVLAAANFCFLLARIGFYVMADEIARPILSSAKRRFYLFAFVVILAIGAGLVSIGGPLIYTFTGWAGGLLPSLGLVWSAGYLVPMLLLFTAFQHATSAHRLRLRWMLWSSVIFMLGIIASNTPILSLQYSVGFADFCILLGVMGFLYAVLRHRVLDVSVVLDRTLVYGAITALVVGVLAAVNSLVEHAALGTSASLLLQVAVPLSLGIVLTRVRAYMDKIVERVFFRKRYLADKALGRFASLCSGFESADELMATAITDIRQHIGARGVAIYERRGDAYVCVRQKGEVVYPQSVKIDDTAFVAARADQTDINLSEFHSTLGSDGYAFPMTAHGELQEVLVCANRPGEHYAVDERQLLAHVAQQMGTALYTLRMQAKARLLEALVQAPVNALPEVQSQARTLLNTATAG